MRLSQLSTDDSLNVLCEITPYLENIITDTELVEEIQRKIDPEKIRTVAGSYLEGLKKINRLVPIVLKTHRMDVYGVLSALNNKTRDEIARQNFIVTGMQIREVFQDKDLLDFLKSFAGTERKT